jgi:hypothetical protein
LRANDLVLSATIQCRVASQGDDLTGVGAGFAGTVRHCRRLVAG